MAKAYRKIESRLARRQRSFDSLSEAERQGRKRPGSFNRRKGL